MVAISLYRGNLHRVPDVPRRWLMPTPRISLKDFRFLIRKRDKALSIATTSSPNPNPNPNSELQEEFVGDNGCSKHNHHRITETPQLQSQPIVVANNRSEEAPLKQDPIVGNAKDRNVSDGDPVPEQHREIDESASSPGTKSAVPDNGCSVKDGGVGGTSQDLREEKAMVSAQPPNLEINNNVDLQSEKEKKKMDLEQKLQVLIEKKHNLVQMLKQILNAEEEMKRRNSMQASVVRPPVPLQVEATVDIGPNSSHVVNRMGSEANFSGDLEGESDDVSNHNTHARNFHQLRSSSPSSSSPLRRPVHGSLQYNAVPHTSRPSMGTGGHTPTTSSMLVGVTASPSRFAPTGHQGHPANLPPVSVSGTHFTASSPSPAASGGTSVFRDARLTSPSWS